MKIKGQVKRVCKYKGEVYQTTHDDIELSQEDIELLLIRKCESMYGLETGVTLSVESVSIEDVN